MLNRTLGILLAVCALRAGDSTPYNGGNQFNSYYTNPNLINSFLTQVNGPVSAACNAIPGIGLPILAVKQVLQNIDNSLSYNNPNTAVKVIFFKEKKNTSNFQTSFKLVAQIKTFSTNNYLAVEGLYKQVGFPAFEVTTYYLDSDLTNIKTILSEYAIDPNSYVGCGDVKSIYSQGSPAQTSSAGNMPSPYNQNGRLVNSAPGNGNANGAANKNDVDPNLIAQIVKLMQKAN